MLAIIWEQHQFFRPTITASKTQDTLSLGNTQVDRDSDHNPSINEQPPVEKKSIAERKLELLIKCAEPFSKPIPQPVESSHRVFTLLFS